MGTLAPASYDLSAYALPTAVTAAAALGLGLYVLARERASRAGRVFFLIPLAIAVWLVGFSLMYCAQNESSALVWARLAYLGVPFAAPGVYHFSVLATSSYPRRRGLVWGFWLLGLVFSVLLTRTQLIFADLYHYSWGFYPRFRGPGLAFVAFFLGVLGLSLFEHWSDARRAPAGPRRARTREYLIAFCIGSLATVDYLAAYGLPVYPFGYLPVLVFLGLTVRAVQRYRLVDITPSFAAEPIVATMADALFVYDAAFRIRLVNRAATALLGAGEHELLDAPVQDLPDPDAPGAAAAFEALVRRSATDEEMSFRWRGGEPVPVSVSISALRDPHALGAVLIARDIRERKRAEADLRRSESKFRTLAESSAVSVFLCEAEQLRYVNPALEQLLGATSAELLERPFWELAHPDSRSAFRQRGLAAQKPGAAPVRFELKLHAQQGSERWVDLSLAPIEVEGRWLAMGTAFDVTERKRAEEALRESERRLRDLLESVQLASVLLDTKGEITFCNEYLLELTGYAAEEVIGASWFQLFVPEEERVALERAFLAEIELGALPPHQEGRVRTRQGELRLIAWNNTILRDPHGQVVGRAALGADVTERQRAEERLLHGALYDTLTGLPNRTLFLDRLAGCMARSRRRTHYRFAVLFLDVDRFKVVNDSLGHVSGDQLLTAVARRLETCLRPGDSVARLGGDEFALLIDDMADGQVPTRVAERIQGAMSVPFELAGHELHVSVSIGIALHKPRYQGPEDFVRDAGTAMHHAKALGRARHMEFDTSMHARAVGQLRIENDLHRALERDELCLHYQPIVSLKTGAIAGFEALLRWQRPDHGLVLPGDFIRVAEENGLIVPMGLWVLREACQRLRSWQVLFPGQPDLMMAVNVSGRQFVQPDLVSEFDRAARESGIAARSLKLEITESVLMQDPEAAAAMLTQIDQSGIQVCIDDFGTGYSSLGYLVRFPASTLKIDRSFVSALGEGRRQSEMVSTIVGLARNLGMDVIAEGVEQEGQVAALRALRCDYAQGFLLSRPLEADAVEQLLAKRTVLAAAN